MLKNMRFKLFVVVSMVSSLVLAGCAHAPGGIAASTKPLPNGYDVIKEVEGEDCGYDFLFFLPLTGGNETKDAVKDALSEAPGADALINVTSDGYSINWILINLVCTQVQGTAVRSR